MPPSKSQVEYFNKAKNYINKFMIESYTINLFMCGQDVLKSESIWLHEGPKMIQKHIKGLKRDMRKYQTTLTKTQTIYRGTNGTSPTMHPFNLDIETCSFISCTKSKKVAESFARFKGSYIHIFKCYPGTIITDVKDHYNTDHAIKSEKEVVLHPKMCLSLVKRKGNELYWDVHPKRITKKRKIT